MVSTSFLIVLLLILAWIINGARDRSPWRTVFNENFTTATDHFPGPAYSQRWRSYDGFPDTAGVGLYDPKRVLSVHDGVLDMYLHTEDGRPLGAAPVPLIDGRWGGQRYGRYQIRFRADSLAGFGAGWLLWPDSNNWKEGEIDFPEGALNATMIVNQHCIGDPQRKCLTYDTGVPFSSGWHTTVIEWKPSGVTYFLDGAEVARTTQAPTTRMHLVLQTATNGKRPGASVQGHVEIDSVKISALR